MRLRPLVFAATLSLGALGVEAQPSATLTLTEARQLAQTALLNGNPALTRQLASGLLVADDEDAHALLLLSAAEGEMKNATEARRAAAKAYRVGKSDEQRMQAAQMAARFALMEDKLTLSQIWLRRAATRSKSDEQDAALASAYRQLRAANPWSVNLNFSVRPSNNVNNGADSEIQVIDGVPVVGFLSRDAQALSGTIIGADIRTNYRLRANARSRTDLAGRLYVQRVLLSDDAGSLTNADFDATYAELALEHSFAIGQRKGDAASLRLTGGAYWSDDNTNYHLARVDADRYWALGENTRLGVGGSFGFYDRPDSDVDDSHSYILRTNLSHKLGGGDTLGLNLTYQKNTSDALNRRSEGWSTRLSYHFAKPWGPAKASASVFFGQTDYPDYRVGFIPVPGGRTDEVVYADLSLFFADYDYAGFAPTVSLRTGATSSNVSRFDTQEFSINFGFQSKF